jgi:hypothetical protein
MVLHEPEGHARSGGNSTQGDPVLAVQRIQVESRVADPRLGREAVVRRARITLKRAW